MANAAQTIQTGRYTYRLLTGARVVQMVTTGAMGFWEMNRAVDAARVGLMVEAQLARRAAGLEYCLGPAPIVAGVVAGRGYVVDGQHRLALLAHLPDPEACPVLLLTVRCASAEEQSFTLPEFYSELEAEFELANSGLPVPAQFYDRRIRLALDRCFDGLAREFPTATSQTAAPKRPRYNREAAISVLSEKGSLRDAVRTGRVTGETLRIKFGQSFTLLLATAARLNETEKAMRSANGRSVPASCLVTAQATGFFLGLDAAWVDRLAVEALRDGTD